jgi:hypothetical protein
VSMGRVGVPPAMAAAAAAAADAAAPHPYMPAPAAAGTVAPVHTIGDSHAVYTFDQIKGVATHTIGPVTMKRIGYREDELLPAAVKQLPLRPTDVLILCFGEPDVRCYVKPQLEHRPVTLAALLQDLVDRYLDAAVVLPANGARVAVLSVTPPANFDRARHPLIDPNGTDAERAEYTRVINTLLAHGCQARNLMFIDVYSVFTDDQGMLPPAVSDEFVHITDTARVRRLLIEMEVLHE